MHGQKNIKLCTTCFGFSAIFRDSAQYHKKVAKTRTYFDYQKKK